MSLDPSLLRSLQGIQPPGTKVLKGTVQSVGTGTAVVTVGEYTYPSMPVIGTVTAGQVVYCLSYLQGKLLIFGSASGGGGAHASTHVSTGSDPIAGAVAGGASGLLTGADKTKLDALSLQAVGVFSAASTAMTDVANGTKLLYETKEWDVSGWYDPATSRYTPLKEGYYRFNGSLRITPAVSNTTVACNLYKNGALAVQLANAHTSTTTAAFIGGSAQAYANGTTDYFELYIAHTFGVTTSDITALGKFQGEYIGSS